MRLLYLVIFMMPLCLFAARTGQVDASADNIPVAFDDTDAGSKMQGCSPGKQLIIHNETASRVAFGIGLTATEPTSDHGFVVANTTTAKDAVTLSNGSFIYIRSDSGSPISAGTVSAECW